MTSEQWHKDRVVAYIVVGVVAVAGIALYVYVQLAAMSAEQKGLSQQAPQSSTATLTPAQMAVKAAAVAAFYAEPSKPLTKSQLATKLAAVKAWEERNGSR